MHLLSLGVKTGWSAVFCWHPHALYSVSMRLTCGAGPRIGCHVSTAGGMAEAVERAKERGCECVQVFTTSPRAWKHQQHEAGQLAAFRAGMRSADIRPVVAHAIYLPNLATAKMSLWNKSVRNLAETCRWAHAAGAATVILHAGHCPPEEMSEGLARTARGLRAVLRDLPPGLTLSLEATAGGPTSVGGRPEHFRRILDLLHGDSRLRVWLDTAHLFAAGHDLRNGEGINRMLAEFRRTAGLKRLSGIHANDSKTPLGSRVDRHENIGRGSIGLKGFRLLVNHPLLRRLPFILEIPGFDNKGPDLRNMNLLKSLRRADSRTA